MELSGGYFVKYLLGQGALAIYYDILHKYVGNLQLDYHKKRNSFTQRFLLYTFCCIGHDRGGWDLKSIYEEKDHRGQFLRHVSHWE